MNYCSPSNFMIAYANHYLLNTQPNFCSLLAAALFIGLLTSTTAAQTIMFDDFTYAGTNDAQLPRVQQMEHY